MNVYIGIDLHRNRFTCCIRLENERSDVTKGELEDLGRFVKKLRPSNEIAVEITGNTRLFYDAVAPHVARVVVVNTKPVQGDLPVGKEDGNQKQRSFLRLAKDENQVVADKTS